MGLRGTGVSGVASITGGTAQFSDGTSGAPSIAFASSPTTGWYLDTGTGRIVTRVAGADACGFLGNNLILPSGGKVVWTSGGVTATGDTVIQRGSAGVVQFASANSFSANGSVATVLGSLGPTGSHTTVQKWLTIQDNGAVVGYIPMF
jgi:hypothetical protein